MDFEALDDTDAAANIEALKQEIERARTALAGKQLDDVVPSHGHHPERTRDIRWIYLVTPSDKWRFPGLIGAAAFGSGSASCAGTR